LLVFFGAHEEDIAHRGACGFGTLASSLAEARVPATVMLGARKALAGTIDFGRKVGAGDRFYMRYRQPFTVDGTPIGTAQLIWLELRTTTKGTVALHRFPPNGGSEQLWLSDDAQDHDAELEALFAAVRPELKQWFDEMRNFGKDQQGRRVLLGLTADETIELAKLDPLYWAERERGGKSDLQRRYDALRNKHDAARQKDAMDQIAFLSGDGTPRQ
jgi:hypothetical protein